MQSGHKTRVLAVENDPVFNQFLKSRLEYMDLEVTVVDSGLQALQELRRHTFDVLATDLVMPNIDGTTLCRIVRRHETWRSMYIIVVTATAPEDHDLTTRIPADAFIAKRPLQDMKGDIERAFRAYREGERLPRRVLGAEHLEERRITRELLQRDQNWFRAYEKLHEGILALTEDNYLVALNPAAETLLGISGHEALARRLDEVLPGLEIPEQGLRRQAFNGRRLELDAARRPTAAGAAPVDNEPGPSGKMPPIGTSTPIEPPVDGSAEASAEGSAQAPTQGSAATPESGEPIWSLIVRDVTREQEAAEELEQRVNDRELMMRELHHRLKNNIFMVAGYIDIQSTEDLDDRARQTLQTVRGNLESMALAHERLYRESSLSEISFGEYLTDVVHAAAAMRGAGIATRVSVAGSSCPMEMNRALRLGLVVNELVVNAVEHAFPEQRGEVLVALETGESGKTGETTDGKTGRLLIQDDGVGLPAESEGFGMEIVAALVEQVGGTLRFFNNRELATEVGGNAPDTGTSVVIDFACG